MISKNLRSKFFLVGFIILVFLFSQRVFAVDSTIVASTGDMDSLTSAWKSYVTPKPVASKSGISISEALGAYKDYVVGIKDKIVAVASAPSTSSAPKNNSQTGSSTQSISTSSLLSVLRKLFAEGMPEDIKKELQGPQGVQGVAGVQGPAGTTGYTFSNNPPAAPNPNGPIGIIGGFASLGVQELTSKTIVATSDITQTGGNTILKGTTVGGAFSVTGGASVDTLTVSGATTLTGSTTFSGALSASGQLVLTKVPTLAHAFSPSWPAGTSNISDATLYINPASAIADTNLLGIAVNGSPKFLVDAEGDIFSSGAATLGSGASATNTLGSGASSINTIGSTTTPGVLTLHGATTISDNVTVAGTTGATLSGNNADMTFTGTGNHDITASSGTLRIGATTMMGSIDALDDTVDIGNPATRFDKIYANEVNATTLVGLITGGNSSSETFSLNSDNVTADTEDVYLSFERGSVTPNALLQWVSASDLFDFNSHLRLTGTIQADPSIILNSATATDTDFWLGVQEDAGGDDDDTFQIGDGTTPGSNTFLTIDTSGNLTIAGSGSFGGGYGSTGVSISTAGNIQANGTGTFDGALTALTYNGNTITTGTGTLTLGAGKTLTASNTLTFTGTDGTSFAFPGTSDTVVTLTATQVLTNKSLTSPTITGSPTAAGATWTDLGTITTADINGGTIDGSVIGGASAAAGTFTTINASGLVSLTGSAANIALGSNYLSGDGGDEGVFVDSTGKVGIGFTTPQAKLEVYKTDDAIDNILAWNDGAGTGANATIAVGQSQTLGDWMRYGVNGAGATTAGGFVQDAGFMSAEGNLSGGLSIITRNASAPIRFYTGGHTNERMRISEGGNVGIGATTPLSLLQVQGSNGQTTYGSATVSNQGIAVISNANTTGRPYGIQFGTWAGTTFGGIYGVGTGVTNNTIGDIAFAFRAADDASTTFAETWRFKNTGHLLTGTDNVYDIGASGATRPRTGYFGTSLVSPLIIGGSATIGATQTTFADGSASAPSIAFTNELGLNTGFYLIGNNNIGVASSGVKLWEWNGTGIGIGIVPVSTFDVNRTGAGIQVVGSFQNLQTAGTDVGVELDFDGESSIRMSALMSAWEGASTAAGYLAFHTRGSSALGERMRITSAGNVGIGTVAPGLIGYTKALTIHGGTSAGQNAGLELVGTLTGNSQAIGAIDFFNTSSTKSDKRVARVIARTSSSYDAEAGDLGFWTTNVAGSETENMTILASGNVGIGDTTPTSLLTVGSADNFQVNSSGHIGFNTAPLPEVGIYLTTSTVLSGATAQYGAFIVPVFNSEAIGSSMGLYVGGGTQAASFTAPNVWGIYAAAIGKGAGSTITNAIGIYAATQTNGTRNYGIRIEGAASGTENYGLAIDTVAVGANNYAIYSTALAKSYFAGDVGIGTTTPTTINGVAGAYQNVTNFTGAGTTSLNVTGGSYANLSLVHSGAGSNDKWSTITNLNGVTYISSLNDAGSGVATGWAFDHSTGFVGINTTAPQSLLDVQGPTGTGAAGAGILTLATKELTIVDGDELGRINFNSPLESDGSDAILAGAAIWAEADDTFSATVNSTELVFGTATTSAAVERMRIDSAGNVGIDTTAPDSIFQIGSKGGSQINDILARTKIYGLATQSQTEEVMLRLIRNENGGQYYPGSADFKLSAYQAGGSPFLPASKLVIALKATTNYNESANVDVMTLLSSGSVGIGTTTPVGKTEIEATLTGASETASMGLNIDVTGSGSSGAATPRALYAELLVGYTGAASTFAAELKNRSAGTGTNYGVYGASTGAGTTNIGGYFTASGATNNYGLIVGAGNVGIGATTPTENLVVGTDLGNVITGTGIVVGNATAGQFAGLILGESNSVSGSLIWSVDDNRLQMQTDGNDYPILIGPTSVGGLFISTDTNSGNVGIGTAAPQSLLDVQGPIGTGAAGAGILTLATKELTIVDDDQLGRINFNSPLESDGSDAILSGAAIWAEAEATFDATTNSTALVFGTATTSAAIERMRITSGGQLSVPAGLVSAPSYVFTGDTNTGFYSGGSGVWNFTSDGATPGIALDTNVELNTVTSAKVQWGSFGANVRLQLYNDGNAGYLYLNDGQGAGVLLDTGANNLRVRNLANNAFIPTLTSAVYGTDAANGDVTIEGTSHATKTTSYVNLQPTSGNVGIGTIAPGAKLDVWNGSIYMSDTDVDHGITGYLPTNTGGALTEVTNNEGGLRLVGLTDGNSDAAMMFIAGQGVDPSDTQALMWWRAGIKSGTTIAVPPSAAQVLFEFQTMAGTSLLNIQQGGNIGIGSADLGDGVAGPVLTLGRNTNATNTGAGSINFLSKAGTAGYTWQDAAGKLRIHTAAPTHANDVAGVVVGDQTSLRETKQDINDYTDYTSALSMVLDAPLHTFRYIKEVNGYGIASPLAKLRIGYIADEVNPAFMVGNSIDQVSVNGILMASVKALDLKINNLDVRVAALEANSGNLTNTFGQYASDFFSAGLQSMSDGVAYMKGIVTETLKVGSSQKRTGITLFDEVTGDPYCVSVANGSQKIASGECVVIDVTNTPPPAPPAPPLDTTPPVITLNGEAVINLNVGDVYEEQGAIATDDVDGSVPVIVSGGVDTSVAGTYTVHYNTSDSSNNNATEVTRTVNVVAVQP